PVSKVAAVFEVGVGNSCRVEELAGAAGVRVLAHPDDDDRVGFDGRSDLVDDLAVPRSDAVPDGVVDGVFGEKASRHVARSLDQGGARRHVRSRGTWWR